MSFVNVDCWSAVEVAQWIAGLHPSIAIYSASFKQQKVGGAKFIQLAGGDLVRYGVNRVGDQLLFEEALQTLRWELSLSNTTLQTLASNLAVRCRNYRSELSAIKSPLIPTACLASASFLLDSAKSLCRWMIRFPFANNLDYDVILGKLVKHCFELGMGSQRDSFADNVIEEAQYLCTKLIELCELLIHSKDSLVIQPAYVDYITLRKRSDQEIGLHLETNHYGVHTVTGVKMLSPAQQSGHVEKGDEVLQVNFQTVVGWPSISESLLESPTEINLTIKRRPRHATANLLLPHAVYLRPSSTKKKKKPISPVLEKEADSESEGSSPLNPPQRGTLKDLKDIDLFKNSTKIKRRATVTGASPTSSRPPVTFDTECKRPPLVNSKSAPEENFRVQVGPRSSIAKQEHVLGEESVSDLLTGGTCERKLLHSGVLHIKKTESVPARWVRTSGEYYDDRTLIVGGSEFKIEKGGVVRAGLGVSNRPFVFKVSGGGEESQISAESQLDYETWSKYLIGPQNQGPPPRVYKRSISLGSSSLSKSPLSSQQRKCDWFTSQISSITITSSKKGASLPSSPKVTLAEQKRSFFEKKVCASCKSLKEVKDEATQTDGGQSKLVLVFGEHGGSV